jgi:hypothetical protein
LKVKNQANSGHFQASPDPNAQIKNWGGNHGFGKETRKIVRPKKMITSAIYFFNTRSLLNNGENQIRVPQIGPN